jgi:hypothetical protein
MNNLPMDEEKLADAITNLEIVQTRLKKIVDIIDLDEENMKSCFYSLQLLRESIDILRNFEIRSEIERFSVIDDE